MCMNWDSKEDLENLIKSLQKEIESQKTTIREYKILDIIYEKTIPHFDKYELNALMLIDCHGLHLNKILEHTDKNIK